MNRRTFLRSSATAATLAFTPTMTLRKAEAAPPQIASGAIWKWLGKLVVAVVPVVLDHVLDWIEGDSNAQQQGNTAVIDCQNRNYTVYNSVYMNNGVNTNNNVYCFGTSNTGYTDGEMVFIYPLLDGSFYWTRLGSLAIYGLSQAANTLAQWYSPNTIGNLLFPYYVCSCEGNILYAPQNDWYVTYSNGYSGSTTISNKVTSCKCSNRKTYGTAELSVTIYDGKNQYIGAGTYPYAF